MSIRFSTLVAATAMLGLCVGTADAQPSKKLHAAHAKAPAVAAYTVAEITAPPLTVRKRSFLDPGNVVAPGSDTPEYIAASTTELRPVTASYAPAFFGESELPGRFDLPPSNPRFNPSSQPHIPLPFDE